MDNDKATKLLNDERTRLLGLRRRIENVGGAAQEDSLSELSTVDQHPADVGSETFERTKELAVQEEITGRLDDVEHALAKLADGTYGKCEICGNAIPEERLEALPASRYCVDHQAQQERGVAVE